MKKMLIGLIVGSLITTASAGALAAPGGYSKHGPGPHRPGYEQKQDPHRYDNHDQKDWELKSDAGYVLKRTAEVMAEAQQMGRRSHRYSGFALAAAHQQKARELYFSGSYREAIIFSLRARDLTFQIISDNQKKIRPEYRRDAREERYYDRSEGAQLDARLDRHKIGPDHDAVRIKMEFNL